MLKLAATVERASQHPIGQSICGRARTENQHDASARFLAPRGEGRQAVVGARTVVAGITDFWRSTASLTQALRTKAAAAENRRDGCVYRGGQALPD